MLKNRIENLEVGRHGIKKKTQVLKGLNIKQKQKQHQA